MIWTPTPPIPLGTTRVVRCFAFLPVELVNGDKLWLERYYAVQRRTALYWEIYSEEWTTDARTSMDPTPILATLAGAA